MHKCEECHFYKNGCDFSESNLPEEELKRVVACVEFFSNDDLIRPWKKHIGYARKRSFSGGITMFEKGDFEWCEKCMCENCENSNCDNYQCKNCDGTCEEHCPTHI